MNNEERLQLVEKLLKHEPVNLSKNIKYETAADFLASAARLATMTSGQCVYVNGKTPAVFLKHDMGSGRACVLYYDGDKEICVASAPYACLTFEPVEPVTHDPA
jgi:hypothetical protein